MAYRKTLGENWTLRDMDQLGQAGVFAPFSIEQPMPVLQALRQRGLVAPRPVGLDPLKDQWPYAHGWLYETCFQWDGQDERCQLLCDRVVGLKAVTVNGQVCQGAGQGAVRLDITPFVAEGENVLGIWVAPRGVGPLGIGAPVQLQVGNFMTLQGAAFSVDRQGVEARLELDVHTAGKYLFQYGAMLDDQAVGNLRVEEKLRPGPQALCHRVPLDQVCAYDGDRPEETTYALRLAVERQAIGCLLLSADCAYMQAAPRKVVALHPDLDAGRAEGEMALAKALGADGVYAQGRAISPLTGLMQAPEPARNEKCPVALAQLEDMQQLAGDQPYWPPHNSGVWALSGSSAPDPAAMQALFGPNALGDAGRAARLSRFCQAEWVRRLALEARVEAEPCFIAALKEESPCLGSHALVEASGAARPAYDALQEAWRQVAVYAKLPADLRVAPGQTAKIPLWLLSGGARREVARLQASCLTLEGKEIASVSLPTMLGEDKCAGEIACPLPPGDRVYVLRLEALTGENALVARADFTLIACDGEAPMAPVMALEGALLREKNGLLINEGSGAALGVCSAGYRALMPGETMPCADTYECLNGLL